MIEYIALAGWLLATGGWAMFGIFGRRGAADWLYDKVDQLQAENNKLMKKVDELQKKIKK